IIALINGLPSGIISMSDEIGGLVQSSSNLGIVDVYPGKAQIVAHMRSSEPAEMDAMSAQVEACAKETGAAWNIPSEYPGWALQKESRFRDLATEVYRGMYGSEPELEIIHAGLECGILKGKMPDLDIISTGPNVWDLHSPDERLSISSFERVYDYVVLLLSKMDDDCGL
nr:M20/M25/M40 family metallo-hydrolase [Lachnospiraceae bacterium]